MKNQILLESLDRHKMRFYKIQALSEYKHFKN